MLSDGIQLRFKAKISYKILHQCRPGHDRHVDYQRQRFKVYSAAT